MEKTYFIIGNIWFAAHMVILTLLSKEIFTQYFIIFLTFFLGLFYVFAFYMEDSKKNKVLEEQKQETLGSLEGGSLEGDNVSKEENAAIILDKKQD